jgi:hypothetical protein
VPIREQSNAVALPFTLLHRLEFRNAIELAMFQKRATAAQAAEVWKTIETDVTAGLLTEVSLSFIDLFAKAQELVAKSHRCNWRAKLGRASCGGGKFAGR